jgi:hypothetical protein
MIIFYCLIWDSPNLEGQVPVFISPRNRVPYRVVHTNVTLSLNNVQQSITAVLTILVQELLTWLRFSSVCPVALGRCWDSISLRHQSFPSKSFPIHQSSHLFILYSLGSGELRSICPVLNSLSNAPWRRMEGVGVQMCRYWLRHYATIRKVARSRPDEINEFLQFT